jgi:hypothetical protein
MKLAEFDATIGLSFLFLRVQTIVFSTPNQGLYHILWKSLF